MPTNISMTDGGGGAKPRPKPMPMPGKPGRDIDPGMNPGWRPSNSGKAMPSGGRKSVAGPANRPMGSLSGRPVPNRAPSGGGMGMGQAIGKGVDNIVGGVGKAAGGAVNAAGKFAGAVARQGQRAIGGAVNTAGRVAGGALGGAVKGAQRGFANGGILGAIGGAQVGAAKGAVKGALSGGRPKSNSYNGTGGIPKEASGRRQGVSSPDRVERAGGKPQRALKPGSNYGPGKIPMAAKPNQGKFDTVAARTAGLAKQGLIKGQASGAGIPGNKATGSAPAKPVAKAPAKPVAKAPAKPVAKKPVAKAPVAGGGGGGGSATVMKTY